MGLVTLYTCFALAYARCGVTTIKEAKSIEVYSTESRTPRRNGGGKTVESVFDRTARCS